jgi:plastocyanin
MEKRTTTLLAPFLLVAVALAGCMADTGEVSGAVLITDAPSQASTNEPIEVMWHVGAEDDDAGVSGNVSGGNGSGGAGGDVDFGQYTTKLYWGYMSASEPSTDAYENSTTEQMGSEASDYTASFVAEDEGMVYVRAWVELDGNAMWSEEHAIEVSEGNATGNGTTVEITDGALPALAAYEPAAVTIKVGEAVVWENGDDVVHTATAEDGSWETGDIEADNSSEPVVFDTAGEYAYQCQYHGQTMQGTVIVEESNATA